MEAEGEFLQMREDVDPRVAGDSPAGLLQEIIATELITPRARNGMKISQDFQIRSQELE